MNRAIELVVAPLGRSEEDVALLSLAERERAGRFRFERDRDRYVAAHAILRRLLAARPRRPRLRYSVSRSEALAAYAFADGRAVGVDVEAIRPLAAADRIARAAFPRREWHAYAALPPRARLRGFFRGWTRTEALAKALGGGLALGPGALDAALQDGWLVRDFMPAPGFAGALACSP